MLKNIFQSSKVATYTVGKNEAITPLLEQLPTVTLEQTHSANFIEITEAQTVTVKNVDAVITKVPNLHLKIKHADCLPILIYHPQPLIAAIHAGRKGTEQLILTKVLEYLKSSHGVSDQLSLWFGPAICESCYQIDKATNKHYNLIAKNTEQVRAVFSESQATITYSNICTAHNNDEFFSYRKEGKGVPMNWSGITLL
jgi:YfiH family protein